MSTEEICQYKNAEPFRPFQILLRTGRSVFVRGKNSLTFSPSQRQVLVDIGSAFSLIDIPDIERLKVWEPRHNQSASS